MYVYSTLLYLGTFNVLKYCFYSNFDNLARTLLNNAVPNSIDVSLWSVLRINKLTFSQFYLHSFLFKQYRTGKIAASHFNFGCKLDILKIWLKLCISQFFTCNFCQIITNAISSNSDMKFFLPPHNIYNFYFVL